MPTMSAPAIWKSVVRDDERDRDDREDRAADRGDDAGEEESGDGGLGHGGPLSMTLVEVGRAMRPAMA